MTVIAVTHNSFAPLPMRQRFSARAGTSAAAGNVADRQVQRTAPGPARMSPPSVQAASVSWKRLGVVAQ